MNFSFVCYILLISLNNKKSQILCYNSKSKKSWRAKNCRNTSNDKSTTNCTTTTHTKQQLQKQQINRFRLRSY